MKRILSTVANDPGRTAMCIAVILYGPDRCESRFPSVLHELLELEEQAQVVRQTDELGVARWYRANETDTHGPKLGPEVLTNRSFHPTPNQRRRLDR